MDGRLVGEASEQVPHGFDLAARLDQQRLRGHGCRVEGRDGEGTWSSVQFVFVFDGATLGPSIWWQ